MALNLFLLLQLSLVSAFTWRIGSNHVRCLPSASINQKIWHLSSTAAPLQEGEKAHTHNQQLLECKGCNTQFNSRNALFRHLRGEDEASINCPLSMGAVSEEEILMTAVIRYGYFSENMENATTNEIVADRIYEAFVQSMNGFLDENEFNGDVQTSALSYSTAAKMRQPSLRQDEEVIGATSEVLSFNYRLSSKPIAISKWKEHANMHILEKIQSCLDDGHNDIEIKVHNIDALLPRSSKMYAERSCSQQRYRYLLPIRWLLPDDDVLRADAISKMMEWWNHISPQSTTIMGQRQHHPRSTATGPKAPAFVKQLKQALKALESKTVHNRRTRRAEKNTDSDDANSRIDSSELSNNDSPIRLAPGRFGQLWRKRRVCWSNFASSKLSGMAVSPGHEAVWRTMDRAKIVGFVDFRTDADEDSNTDQTMHIILEFCADGFLLGQIPKIISVLVANTNGWLSPNYFDMATRPDVYLPAPPPPPNLEKMLYFHSARFHFHELLKTGNGKDFEHAIYTGSQSEQSWEVELRKKLIEGMTPAANKVEEDWLEELRDNVSPDLRKQILAAEKDQSSRQSDQAQGSSTDLPIVNTDAPEGMFATTLGSLRDVVENKKWPATSDSRSRVIKTTGTSPENVLATKKKALASQFQGAAISAGSFTVVNPKIWNAENGLPLANSLFPELTRAVFELEEEITREVNPPLPSADGIDRQESNSIRRQSSTHCAVNRNAQFTPHVDTGRGSGQSVSMIVGLGNYTGGEILVDGKPYGIRYNALEFDGWNQLHWTAPFVGERYSLVWFTPEVPPRKDATQQSQKLSNLDDDVATRLAKEHSKAVPFLSPLQFRPDSTDALVLKELLGSETECAYYLAPNAYMPSGFTLQNHKGVLDVGAHIGAFSRVAIANGCKRIVSYEPEPSNYELLTKNLEVISQSDGVCQPMIELHSSAVASESSSSRTLVQARAENSGKQNTWRHSLEEYSQYHDRSTKLSSQLQLGELERFSVPCVSFFGNDGNTGALVPGITLVKLDCEGAEVDILLSNDASQRSAWIDVTHVVIEWSFTKERRVSIFHKAMRNLRDAGFDIYYEGIGSWWDTEAGVMWPYPQDLIVFATIKSESKH